MKYYTIMLEAEEWELIAEILREHTDRGPEHEGWQSDELASVSGALSHELQKAKAK